MPRLHLTAFNAVIAR